MRFRRIGRRVPPRGRRAFGGRAGQDAAQRFPAVAHETRNVFSPVDQVDQVDRIASHVILRDGLWSTTLWPPPGRFQPSSDLIELGGQADRRRRVRQVDADPAARAASVSPGQDFRADQRADQRHCRDAQHVPDAHKGRAHFGAMQAIHHRRRRS